MTGYECLRTGYQLANDQKDMTIQGQDNRSLRDNKICSSACRDVACQWHHDLGDIPTNYCLKSLDVPEFA
jgi:hypothetical protein